MDTKVPNLGFPFGFLLSTPFFFLSFPLLSFPYLVIIIKNSQNFTYI